MQNYLNLDFKFLNLKVKIKGGGGGGVGIHCQGNAYRKIYLFVSEYREKLEYKPENIFP